MSRLPLLLPALLLLASPATAAEREWRVEGQVLSIATSCARSIRVVGNRDIAAGASVTASAEQQAEIDQLTVTGGQRVEIGSRDSDCPHLGRHREPTLDVTVRVPTRFAITMRETGPTDHVIDAVTGPLSAMLSGSGNLTAASATPLQLEMRGSGNARVTETQGPLNLSLSGSGDLTLDRVDAPTTDLTLRGSGDVTMAGGNGRLRAQSSGSGNLVAGDTSGAEITFSGSGNVRLEAIAGAAILRLSGSGGFRASRIDAPSLQVENTGSGEVRIDEGRIGDVQARASGSGGIDLRAAVGDADLSNRGSGDIRILSVSGRLSRNSSGSGEVIIKE